MLYVTTLDDDLVLGIIHTGSAKVQAGYNMHHGITSVPPSIEALMHSLKQTKPDWGAKIPAG